MQEVKVTVKGISRREYATATREHNIRSYGILLFVAIFIAFIITWQQKAVNIKACLICLSVWVGIVAAWELLTLSNYKAALQNLPAVTYTFTPEKWCVDVSDQHLEFKWGECPKLTKRGSCYFLYNDVASSNLLPRSQMQGESEELIKKWFYASREDYKAFKKEKEKKERKELKEGIRSDMKEVKSRSPFFTSARDRYHWRRK